MELQSTTVSQRCHIAFFGCTNAGKSSLVNAICSQEVALVSEVSGTTTDPVKKTMELLPIGPVVIIDTAGFDDKGKLGHLRIQKTNQILSKTDIAILVVDSTLDLSEKDKELINLFVKKNIPYLIVYNKSDLNPNKKIENENEILVSALLKNNIEALKEKIGQFAKKNETEKYIICDKLSKNSTVVLVIPIDESAPKGRLILPQQNTIRELLDFHHKIVCTQVEELGQLLSNLKTKPNLVITDSQAFKKVKDIVPNDICLTSFSILFARYKGNLEELVKSVKKIKELENNDKILISEGCTHHRQCNDIGSVKIPKWLKEYTKKDLRFEYTQGGDFPLDLTSYKLIIHCGGCMLNEKEMQSRIEKAKEQNVNIVNYGIFIAFINGILKRSLEIFPEIEI